MFTEGENTGVGIRYLTVKVILPYVGLEFVALHKRTFRFEWYMASFVVYNGHAKRFDYVLII